MIQTVLSKRFVMLFAAVMMSIMTFAQNVTGVVKDSKGDPIIGASVLVQGTKIGAVTDMDGKYSISGVKPGQTLVVSYVGYLTKDVKVGNSGSVNITLSDDNQALDELVVVGYGVQKRSDVTGAMTSVTAKELNTRPISNALEGMQGKAAGVDIRTSDRPGEMGDVYIRGVRSLNASSTPLYVVDGVPLNGTVGQTYEEQLDSKAGRGGQLESLNPQDIESIEILKDASATAIYGSRGANGVVLITTKKGKEGRFTVSYSGSMTVDYLKDKTTWMSADEYITWRRWARYYSATDKYPRGDQPTKENDYDIFNGGGDKYAWANIEKGWAGGTWDGSKVATTDWASLVTQTGFTMDHTVSATTGTEKSQSYFSIGWLDNRGTVRGQDYNRYTAKISNDTKPFKWLSLGASINATYSIQNYGMSNDGGTTSGPRSAYAAAMRNLPYAVPYDDEGNRIIYPGSDDKIKTVVDEWNYSTDERKVFRALGSFYGQVNLGEIWEPLKGLQYKINFGPDFRYYRRGMFNSALSTNREGTNYTSLTKSTDFSWTLDNMIMYNRTFGQHEIGVTLLQTATKYEYESNSMSAQDIPLESAMWNALTTTNVTSLKSWNSALTEKQLESYMARLNYTFMGRYMLTASVRADGASQLATGHKWATFPSVALAWRIDQENFMKDLHWIDNLKLRVGYGVTGNAAIEPYQTKGSIVSLFYPYGNAATQGYTTYDAALSSGDVQMANQNLSWEKTSQWNFGLDFSFLNGRINGTFDIYTSRTTDLLMLQAIPTVTGYAATYNNIGETKNFGYDVTLNFEPIRTKDWSWKIGLNAAYTKNEIVSLANGTEDDVANGWFIGESTYVYYDYVYDGLWQNTPEDLAEMAKFNANGSNFQVGMTKVKDLNGDYKIDANHDKCVDDRNRDPRWTVGLSTTLSWKNWELYIQAYGRMDYYYDSEAPWVGGRYNVRSYDYYCETNTSATYSKPIFSESGLDPYYSLCGVHKGDYLKVRTISLGYTFPQKILKGTPISALRLYAQAKNPFSLMNNYESVDLDSRSNLYNQGFTFGVNISF